MRNIRPQLPLALPALYVLAIVLANVLTQHYGLVSIGLGLTCTAGTFAAGAAILLRNLTQDVVGRIVVLILMAVGVVISYVMASPALAYASAAAFALSELCDMTVYTWLREQGWTRAVIAAGAVGSVVDSVVFLWIAGFPIWSSLPGQLLVKFGMTLLGVALYRGSSAVFRQPSRPVGS